MAGQSKSSKNPRHVFADGSHETDSSSAGEQLAKIPSEITRAMWRDFFKASLKKNLPEQMTGKELNRKEQKTAGELIEGQEITLESVQQIEGRTVVTREHQEYVRSIETESLSDRKEQAETQQQISALEEEIRKLIKSTKDMEAAFKQVSNQVTVDSSSQEVGRYHVTFLEWVLIVVKSARMRVDEGQSWMALFASKKKQKQFWNRFKKGGTSFLLSGERTSATQTG